jgi:tetratricopeptide (TPR) repeat protein
VTHIRSGRPPEGVDVIGRTLNQCKILSKLGSGGMGEVYLAEDQKLNRQVALKLLPEDMASDPERRMRFEREAQAIAALNHPNIVTIYSVEECEGLTFLTMELVEGRSLGELFGAGGMPLKQFLELSISLADAVGAAHEAGITHRDLKPDNVMVNEQGRLKVLDFGLAKLKNPFAQGDGSDVTQIPTTAETREGMILGTVAYMSPEQAQGQGIGPASDVFSLGIILYEMATGERPFQGENNISVLSAILKDSPRPVTELKAGLPAALQSVLDRALQKWPEKRWASANELREALETIKREVDTGELLSSTGVSGLGKVRAAARPRRVPIVGLAVVGLAVLAIGLIAFGPRKLGSSGSTAPVAVADLAARPSLAVFYFENITGDTSLDWLKTGLTDMLVTDLSQSPNLRVLDTARLYQILDGAGRLDEAKTSVEAMNAVARRADIATALVGSFVRAGSTIRINARLQDARSGEILKSEQVEGEGESSIFGLVDDLSRRIQGHFDVVAVADAGVDRDLEDVTTDSVDAYKYYAEGIRLHEQFKEEEALPLLEKAAEVDPDFGMALAKLSVVHGNLGHWEEAKEFAQRAVNQVERLSARERYYIEGRHFSLYPETKEESIAAYRKAVELFPDHSSARNNLAQALSELRRYDESIEHLEELRRRGMTFPGTWSHLAKMYGVVGRPEEGRKILEEYVRDNPTVSAGHRNLAAHLAASGRYEEALATLEVAESIDPGNHELGWQQCNLHLLRGDWDAAAEAVAGIRESSDPMRRFQAAGCDSLRLIYTGQTAAAHDLSRGLLEAIPESAPYRIQLLEYEAQLLISLEEWDAALEMADRLIAAGNEDESIGALITGHAITVVIFTQRGELEEARPHQRRIDELRAKLPEQKSEFLKGLFGGLTALVREDYPVAIEHFERAEELLGAGFGEVGTDLALVRYSLAEAYLGDGRAEDAKAAFQRIVDAGLPTLMSPFEYVRSLYWIGDILDRQGDEEAARDYYRRFLDHWGDGDVDRELVERARERVAAESA